MTKHQPDSLASGDVAPPPPPRELHEAGTFYAQCVDVINLGTEPQVFQGEDKGLVPKGAFVFRTGELDSEGRPLDISYEFSVMTGTKANLRKMCESWRGAPYDVDYPNIELHKMFGVSAMLTIVHQTSGKGNTYAKIVGIAKVPKGTQVPDYTGAYERADFWEKRKAAYAAASAEWMKKHAKQDTPAVAQAKAQQASQGHDFEEFPAAEDEGDDLPFR